MERCEHSTALAINGGGRRDLADQRAMRFRLLTGEMDAAAVAGNVLVGCDKRNQFGAGGWSEGSPDASNRRMVAL